VSSIYQTASRRGLLGNRVPKERQAKSAMLCWTFWLVCRGDLVPEFVKGDAVEEGGRLDH
jgi:hypothetical protein